MTTSIPISGVSVVVPVYDEADNIAPLVVELTAALARIDVRSEILFVDDGSTDDTRKEIESALERVTDLRCVRLSENRGQSTALLMGVHAAAFSHVVTMDGDLQNDPADICALLSALEGHDAVIARRQSRRDSAARVVAGRVANAVRRLVLRDEATDTGCALKLMPRAAYLSLPAFDGMHRFLPALLRSKGLRIAEIAVSHRPRTYGRSKYTNLGRLRRTLPDLLGVVWLSRRAIRLRP